jgi:uncharacterized protein YidB (DUF937 family)
MSFTDGLPAAVLHLIDQHGGVGGLMQQFEAGGLGSIAQSWIGGGQNQMVSPDQLHAALGSDAINAAAQHSGMSSNDLLGQLAQYLPQLVDHLTPGGQIPPNQSGGWTDTAMAFLRSR